MLAYLSVTELAHYLHGDNAPIWRALVSPDVSTALNVVAAVLTAIAIGFAVERIARFFLQERMPFLGAMVAAAFFCVPPFALHIVGLSPLMATLLPISLSLAALMLPTSVELAQDEEAEEERNGGEYRMLLSGAFAAIGAWEGTLGLAFLPIILMTICLPVVCRELPLFRAMAFWAIGFLAAAVAEGLCLGFDFSAVKLILPPLFGLVIFLFIGIAPAFVVIRLGWNRLTAGVWAGVLAIFLVITLGSGYYWAESGGERFAKAVLKDLGERKLIIADGLSDDFFTLLKPADVRLVGTRSDADREFLLNFFEGDEPVTNRALVVSQYRDLPEWNWFMQELGFGNRRRRDRAAPERKGGQGTNSVPAEAAMSNLAARVAQDAKPLMDLVVAAEAEFAKAPEARDRAKLANAREVIRWAWKSHAYGGSRLSNVLIMSDLLLGDVKAAEADAITVLTFDRDDPAGNAALGAIRQEEGKFELAERYLRRGVKGGGVFAMGKLAILLIQTDRPQEAVEWAGKAVKVAPRDVSLREPLAAALIECGRLDEAEEELDEIARLAKENGTRRRERAFLSGARARLEELRKNAAK